MTRYSPRFVLFIVFSLLLASTVAALVTFPAVVGAMLMSAEPQRPAITAPATDIGIIREA